MGDVITAVRTVVQNASSHPTESSLSAKGIISALALLCEIFQIFCDQYLTCPGDGDGDCGEGVVSKQVRAMLSALLDAAMKKRGFALLKVYYTYCSKSRGSALVQDVPATVTAELKATASQYCSTNRIRSFTEKVTCTIESYSGTQVSILRDALIQRLLS